jgi:hypothetical protein
MDYSSTSSSAPSIPIYDSNNRGTPEREGRHNRFSRLSWPTSLGLVVVSSMLFVWFLVPVLAERRLRQTLAEVP